MAPPLQTNSPSPKKVTAGSLLRRHDVRLLVLVGLLAGVVGWDRWRHHWTPDFTLETEHYRIHSTATREQAAKIGAVTEVLYDTYAGLFAEPVYPGRDAPGKFQMKLYRDRDEFRRTNRGVVGWAEAFYQHPFCHAYYSAGEANPWHWMLHEATHQLNREAAGLKLAQWLDEGVACYFSTSRLGGDGDDRLELGDIDTATYPVWWLGLIASAGDLEADVANGSVIPLRAIVSGKGGPALNRHFNLYYLHWWSLLHYLLEADEGRHRPGTFALLKEGGSLAGFEKHIGPIEVVQEGWYRHLLGLKAERQ